MRDLFIRDPPKKRESRHYIPAELGNLTNKVVVFCLLSGLGIDVNKADIMPERNSPAFLGILRVHPVFQCVFLACGVDVNAVVGAERISSLDRPLGGVILDRN